MEKSAGLLEVYIFSPLWCHFGLLIGFLGHYMHHRGKRQARYGFNGLTNLGVEMSFGWVENLPIMGEISS